MTICGSVGGACEINQTNQSDIQALNILNLVANIVQSDIQMNKLAIDVENEAQQEDVGVLGGIAGIFKALGTVGVLAIAAGLILLIILIIVGVLFSKRKKSQPQMSSAYPSYYPY